MTTTVTDRVLGRIRYASDFEVPGMWHGVVVRSPYAHATVERIDTSAVPDGAVVLTHADLGDLRPRYGPWIEDQFVLAQDRVRHVGDAVVAVAAPTLEAAREAARVIEIDYREHPAVIDPLEATRPGAPRVHDVLVPSDDYSNFYDLRPSVEENIAHRFRLKSGRGAAGFDEAEVVVERRYTVANANHAPLEPHSTTAWWTGDHLTVVGGTQTPFNNRESLAKLFGIPESQVTVRVLPMGGSFGAKTFLRLEPVVAALARKARVPVQITAPREDVFAILGRHGAEIHVRVGARRDGTLVAKAIDAWWNTGAYADSGPGVAEKGGYAAIGPYRIPHVEVESRCVYTHLPPNGAFRGYAATQAVWAGEQIMDVLAVELGMDPLELRLRNVLVDGDRFATGEVMHNVRFKECLEACAEKIEWRAGRRGKGLAVVLKGMTTPSRSEAALEVTADGTILLRSATTDMGQRPTETQTRIAAAALDVSTERVVMSENDTDVVPFDMRTTSSRSTYMLGEAIGRAASDLRGKVAAKLGVEPAELTFSDVGITGGPGEMVRWPEMSGLVGHGEYVIEGGLEPDTGQGIASFEWHQGAAGVVVDVDQDTGRVTVQHLHTATYAGKVVDPPGARLQTEGSMTLGLGSAFLEELDIDEGQIRNANLSDYSIVSSADMPRITYDLLEDESSPPHGLGETAVPPVPAAIGNALLSLGVGLTRMPIRPDAVVEQLHREGEE